MSKLFLFIFEGIEVLDLAWFVRKCCLFILIERLESYQIEIGCWVTIHKFGILSRNLPMSVLKIMNVQQSGPQHLRYLLCPFRNSVLNSPFCLPFWKVGIAFLSKKKGQIKKNRLVVEQYADSWNFSPSLSIWQHLKKYVSNNHINKLKYTMDCKWCHSERTRRVFTAFFGISRLKRFLRSC